LNGPPSVKYLGRLDVSRQWTLLFHLRDRLADTPLRRFEGRLTIRIVRRILIHHAHGTYIVLPIVQVVIARLAIHFSVHLLSIATCQIFSRRLEIIRFVCRVPQKGGDFRTYVFFGAHGRELLRVIFIVVVNRIAQPLIRIRKGGIRRQHIKHWTSQHLARTRHIRIQLHRHPQSTRRRRRFFRLCRIPTPTQITIIARPKALSRHALGTLLVSHGNERILIRGAYFGIASAAAAAAGSVFIVGVAWIAGKGGVPAPAFFD